MAMRISSTQLHDLDQKYERDFVERLESILPAMIGKPIPVDAVPHIKGTLDAARAWGLSCQDSLTTYAALTCALACDLRSTLHSNGVLIDETMTDRRFLRLMRRRDIGAFLDSELAAQRSVAVA